MSLVNNLVLMVTMTLFRLEIFSFGLGPYVGTVSFTNRVSNSIRMGMRSC